MKRMLPILVILMGTLISIVVGTLNSVTKKIGNTYYGYTNYSLITIGIAISLFVGILLLWIIKKNEKK